MIAMSWFYQQIAPIQGGLFMNSVDNLTIEMLNLSDDNRQLIEELHLPLDEVVLIVRHNNINGHGNSLRSLMDRAIRHEIRKNPSKRDTLKRLSFQIRAYPQKTLVPLFSEIHSGLDHLGMIREFSPEQFQLSANILALRSMMLEGASCAPSRYHQSNDGYLKRLIRKLNNKNYETWQGYNEDTVEKVRTFLKENLSDTEYGVICMGFGLIDGDCKDWQAIAEHFGWKSKGAITYHERNAARRLHPVISEFKELTKIS